MIKAIIILAIGWGLFFIGQMKKYRQDKRILACLLVYMVATYAFCNTGNDVLNYINRYENGIYGMAPLFDIAMQLFKAANIPFVVFKLILGIIVVALLYKSVALCTENVTMVLALIWVFPFPGAVTQIRNGLAAAIVLYSVVIYLRGGRYSTIKYVLGVLIASTIHPTMLFYLAFVLAKWGIRWRMPFKVVLVAMLVVIVHLCVSENLLYILASRVISNPRYLVYFDFSQSVSAEVLNWKGKLLPMLGQLTGYLSFHLIYQRLRRGVQDCRLQGHVLKNSVFQEEQLDMIQFMQLLLLTMLPLYLRTPTYFRMFKNMIPLIHIVSAQYLLFAKETGTEIRQADTRHKFVALCTILAQFAVTYADDGSIFGGPAGFSFFI